VVADSTYCVPKLNITIYREKPVAAEAISQGRSFIEGNFVFLIINRRIIKTEDIR